MSIVIVIAFYAIRAAGGMDHLMSQITKLRATNGGSDPLAFLPDFSKGFASDTLWTLPVITFAVYLGVQWWAFWYPGSEPGGGGYVAQRIFSARDERQGLLSVLWFNIAHFALRPWPWILTALAAIVLYPGLQHPESSYMLMVNEHVPHAFRGIIMAGFLAAFMSTIATQLNWGSSYIVEDFYRRFLVRGATERHYVLVSQITTILLVFATGYVSAQLASIRSGWQVVLQVGAGTGSVYMLRWYWWRINAWSEISAMATALLATIAFNSQSLAQAIVGRPTLFTGSDTVLFAKNVLATTALTTAVWVAVTFLTAQEPNAILISFYRKVLPDVTGWKPIAALTPDIAATRDLARNLWCWLLGTVMVYSALFGVGKLLFHAYPLGAALVTLSTLCAWRMHHELQLPSTR
jgi:Na+/proline symporter